MNSSSTSFNEAYVMMVEQTGKALTKACESVKYAILIPHFVQIWYMQLNGQGVK